MAASLLALATPFLGFAGPAQADGAQSFQVLLDGQFLFSPVDFGAIDKHVGGPGLDWDLTGSYQDEFDQLKR
jgi:hypothetical protein